MKTALAIVLVLTGYMLAGMLGYFANTTDKILPKITNCVNKMYTKI